MSQNTIKEDSIIGSYLVLNAIILSAVPLNAIINVNEIINKSLLAADKFQSEMHLKQPGFT